MSRLYAATLFASATLLFLVQPMFAKLVLPLLGGTPNVWNACMVFYQAALLGGYLYAHFSVRAWGPRVQAGVHLGLLLAPWLVLPVALPRGWAPPAESNPVPWLLMLLTVSVGLPFFVISASAPLLQAWYADAGRRWSRDPYFLYAASNLGSMLALLGYPTLVEPWLPLAWQAVAWTAGYGLLSVLMLTCAVALWRSPVVPRPIAADGPEPGQAKGDRPRPGWVDRLWWTGLAFVPSSLLLGVTAHLSTDIAAVPLLWVVPLALYLLTFVLVFAKRPPLPHRWMLRAEPLLLILLASCFFMNDQRLMILLLVLHLSTFFVVAMVCHGELAARRPGARWLTEFYLWMSAGGVLGGVFNGLVAPLVFSWVVEYPLMLVVACLLRPVLRPATRWQTRLLDLGLPAALAGALLAAVETLRYAFTAIPLSYGMVLLGAGGLFCLSLVLRPVRFALAVLILLVVDNALVSDRNPVLLRTRSFFGVLKVVQVSKPPESPPSNADSPAAVSHVMIHGSTHHGVQNLDPELRRVPSTYYHRTGPLGQIFLAVGHRVREVGVIGLGTGTIATYGRPGMHLTFFEIDPAVVRIAEDPRWFTYLADGRQRGSTIDVRLGDARLALGAARAGQFDLLVLDAFSSDAIPMHLLTREAVQLYFSKLADEGLLALHISNRYLQLGPIVGRLAIEERLVCRDEYDPATEQQLAAGKLSSHWVVMARRREALGSLIKDKRWESIDASERAPLWTDDFSNILSALRWH